MIAAVCGGCGRALRDAFLCPSCADELGRLAVEIPWLLAELATTTYRQDRFVVLGEVAAPRGEQPIPFRVGAARLLAEITLHFATIAERHGVPRGGLGGRPAVTLHAIGAQIAAQARQQAKTNKDAPLTLATLSADAAAARVAIDLPAQLRYLGRCDVCGADLYADRAAVRYDCPTRGCSASYEVAARVAELLDRSRRVPLPALRLTAVLASLDQHVTEERIRKWRSRGRLTPAMIVGPGKQPYYYVGDVLDLLVAEATPRKRRGERS